MLLGEILNALRDEGAAAAALVSLGDIRLMAEVEAKVKESLGMLAAAGPGVPDEEDGE